MYGISNTTTNIQDIVFNIDKGNIKLPQFQREFVWSVDKVAKLFDSVIKGYVIGSFIYWETDEPLRSIKNFGNINLPDAPMGINVKYVLDGQQRITTLYATYKGIKINNVDFSEIYIDLSIKHNEYTDKDIVVAGKNKNKESDYISVSKLFSQDFYATLQNYTNNEIKSAIVEYKRRIECYIFPVIIQSNNTPLSVAIDVFERLNTGGQNLNTFDIMVAKTYDESLGFDLAKEFDKLKKDLGKVGYGEIKNGTILHIVSGILNKNVSKSSILNTKKIDFIRVWEDCVEAIKKSVDHFKSYYRLNTIKMLPSELFLITFSYFFYKNKNNPTGDKIASLEDFFWKTALSERYDRNTLNRLAIDIELIDSICNGEIPKYNYSLNLDIDRLINKGYFKQSFNSFSKTIVCALMINNPLSFSNGSLITTDGCLSTINKKNNHHFFPVAFLKNKDKNPNNIFNITLIDSYTNQVEIKDRKPSNYINDFINNKNFNNIMKSHYIGDLNEFGIIDDDYDKFLEKRAKQIIEGIMNRMR